MIYFRLRPGIVAGLAFAMAAAMAAATVARAGPAESLPSPARRLKEATKNLVRAKSYEVGASIRGGISKNAEHRIEELTVRQSYSAQVYQHVMHVPALKAYRTPKAGVRQYQGYWRNILSDRNGVLCERLFPFPEVLLTRALRHSSRAEWLVEEKQEDGASAASTEDDADSEARTPEDSRRGRTVVGTHKDGESGRKDPRFIRVDTPVKEALQHVIEVENSGCLSGG